MVHSFKYYYLTLVAILIGQFGFAQVKMAKDGDLPETLPILSGVHTLSVHVRDTLTHDSVFQFFADKLKLPIYYQPVMYGQRKYVGIYAGNLVLEPCGPYPNIDYATDDYRSIFYGLNFEVYQSLKASGQILRERGIQHQVNQGSIYIKDSVLCNENIFTAVYEVNDRAKRDALKNTLIANSKNKPGIQYIQEINVAYKEESNLMKWKEYLYPLEFDKNCVCQINDSLQIHFNRGHINEVGGITFKVKSLAETKQYFVKNNLSFMASGKNIKLNPTQCYGLSLYFTDGH